MSRKDWSWFKKPFNTLAKSVTSYEVHLQNKSASFKDLHRKSEHSRNSLSDGNFQTIEVDKSFDVNSPYKCLCDKLKTKEVFVPIFLNDFKEQKNPAQWYAWKKNITLPVRARIFSYDVGSRVGTLSWVYRIPSVETDFFVRRSKKSLAISV